MEETEIAKQGSGEVIGLPILSFTREQVDLIKRTICKGATDDELALFLHVAKTMGLDPLRRQIHAVKRWDSSVKKEVMTAQTGIDGYRLIADRTKKYVPGDVTVNVNDKGKILSATATVKKLVNDEWHDVTATAYFDEYAAKKKDGTLNIMWASKGRLMIMKCAEALALRRAFPAELSGVYTADEMSQANEPIDVTPLKKPESTEKKEPMINEAQRVRLFAFGKKGGKTHGQIKEYLAALKPPIGSTKDIPISKYDEIVKWAETKDEEVPFA